MNVTAERLAHRVRGVGRIGVARSASVALAMIVLAVSAAFLVVSLLDVTFWLHPILRALALIATVASAGWLAAKGYARMAGDFKTEGSSARAVEQSYPEIERSLSTAIEFGSNEEKTREYSSPEIVDTLVKVTDARTAPLEFRRAVDWRPVGRALAGVAIAALLILLYASWLPHMAIATALRFFTPLSNVPPPTWTVIDDLTPGDTEVPRGRSVRIDVSLSGSRPDSVRLMVKGEGEEDWAESEMAAGGEGRFSRTLARVVRATDYRVSAGDALSQAFTIVPVDEPRVESIRVKITPPAYTGLSPTDLPEGSGDVRSPKGTLVEVTVRPNTRKAVGELRFALGRERIESTVDLGRADEKASELTASFTLTESGEYRVKLRDDSGRESTDESVFRLTAMEDEKPKVRVSQPAREVMAAKDQKVTLQLEASDDWGVSEVGIVSTVADRPERISIKKPEPGTREVETKYDVDLSLRGLKGGEIITYYAFAVDNDGSGPKETVGEIRFLRTYDENRYGMSGMQQEQRQRTPEAVKEVEKLIKRQMDLTQETFDIARRGGDAEGPESKEAAKTQDRLKRDLDDFIAAAEKELLGGEEGRPPAMRPEELLELNRASRKMDEATERLEEPAPRDAAAPQSQAIASLSRTRRTMLSQSGEGSSQQQAMNNAGRQREEARRQQRRREQEEFDEEMQKLPPILERQEENRRKLETLEDEPPPQAQADEMASEQRQLAEQARQMASRMEQNTGRNSQSQMSDQPQRKLLEAAEQMERAADATQRRDMKEATDAAEKAEEELHAAQSSGQQTMRDADRRRMQAAAGQAKELAERQDELSKAQGDAGKQADEQERIKKEFEGLMDEVESLAERAEREDRPEARNLRDAQFGSDDAKQNMDEAARLLRGGRASESKNNQQAAAGALSRMSEDLDRASQAADASAQRDLADAVRRAEQLAKDVGDLEKATRDPAQDPKGLAPDAENLRDEAKEIARTAAAFPSHGEESPIKQAEHDLKRAGRELKRAGEELARPDRSSATKSASRAREDAEKAAKAMRDAAFGDMAKALSEARNAAGKAADQAEEARASLDAAKGAGKPDETERARQDAARKEAQAETHARNASSRLASAAAAAERLGSDLSDLINREMDRGERERLPSRMSSLASRLGVPSDDAEGEGESERAAERNDARKIGEDARAAARRIEALAAEARDDELESLRAASEDAKSLSEQMKELENALNRMAKTPGEGKGEGETESERRAKTREMSSKARGLEEDAKSLRERIERRASELLKGRDGEGRPVEDEMAKAEGELASIARRLSRNQPPRPSNALNAGAEAYQVLGEGIIRKIERIIKQREYRPPENEEAPPEYRDLVERYFRALSED